MSTYGTQNLGTVGTSIRLISSDMALVRWKTGGITIDWATVTAVVADTDLTGGTKILAGQKYIPMGTVMVKITSGGSAGKYGPADTTATDGRQTVDATRRGDVYLLDEDISQNPPYGLVQGNASDHPGVFDGGTIWRARLKVGGVNQPTMANFLAAFPDIAFTDI